VPARYGIDRAGGPLLKNASERMDVLAAYREAGSYRGCRYEVAGLVRERMRVSED
jgi:hypothetical protein